MSVQVWRHYGRKGPSSNYSVKLQEAVGPFELATGRRTFQRSPVPLNIIEYWNNSEHDQFTNRRYWKRRDAEGVEGSEGMKGGKNNAGKAKVIERRGWSKGSWFVLRHCRYWERTNDKKRRWNGEQRKVTMKEGEKGRCCLACSNCKETWKEKAREILSE